MVSQKELCHQKYNTDGNANKDKQTQIETTYKGRLRTDKSNYDNRTELSAIGLPEKIDNANMKAEHRTNYGHKIAAGQLQAKCSWSKSTI